MDPQQQPEPEPQPGSTPTALEPTAAAPRLAQAGHMPTAGLELTQELGELSPRGSPPVGQGKPLSEADPLYPAPSGVTDPGTPNAREKIRLSQLGSTRMVTLVSVDDTNDLRER